jgi:hypothetical protein
LNYACQTNQAIISMAIMSGRNLRHRDTSAMLDVISAYSSDYCTALPANQHDDCTITVPRFWISDPLSSVISWWRQGQREHRVVSVLFFSLPPLARRENDLPRCSLHGSYEHDHDSPSATDNAVHPIRSDPTQGSPTGCYALFSHETTQPFCHRWWCFCYVVRSNNTTNQGQWMS